MMIDLAARIERLKPGALQNRAACELRDDGAGPYIYAWDAGVLGVQPTEQELKAVDVLQPTPDQDSWTAAVQILKTDIPAAWRNSANVQQRIAWALRRVLIEVRNELREG